MKWKIYEDDYYYPHLHSYSCWSKLDNEDACQECKTGKLIKIIDEIQGDDLIET